jgi:very-short-patch-repair endonuclease
MVYSNADLLEKKRQARSVSCSSVEYLEKLSTIAKENAKTNTMQDVYRTAKDRVSERMKMSNYERWKEDLGEEAAKNRLEEWSKKVKIPNISKNTLPERQFMRVLGELQIHAIQQYPVLGFVCDFYIPDHNLIVEIDGDFWHANPARFSAYDMIGPKKMKAQEIWEQDMMKKNALECAGYKVIRYWASELKETTSQKIFEDIVQSSRKLEVPQ